MKPLIKGDKVVLIKETPGEVRSWFKIGARGIVAMTPRTCTPRSVLRIYNNDHPDVQGGMLHLSCGDVELESDYLERKEAERLASIRALRGRLASLI